MISKQNLMVSIVTPCLNSESYIKRSIKNVLQQDVEGVEHIIIDGGSTDGTVDILRRYPHLRWISEPDEGQSDALNKGFRMARGEILGWLNADDTYTPGAVQTGVDYLKSHPECDIVYGDCNILSEDGSLLSVFQARPLKGYEKYLGGAIHTPAVFWRRSVFDKIGYLDENLHYIMDNEFWLRAAPVTNWQYLQKALANFYHRSDSKSLQAKAEFGPEQCRVFDAAFHREPYASAIPDAVKQRKLAWFYWNCGVRLAAVGEVQRAKPYLKAAFDRFDVLEYTETVAECIVTRPSEYDVLSLQEALSLVNSLPIQKDKQEEVKHIVRQEYYKLRFYMAHKRGDRQEMRATGWKALSQLQNLNLRGFLSLWVKSFLSDEFANTHLSRERRFQTQ